MEMLSKAREKEIRKLYARKGRNESGLCICEGLRACRELYKFSKNSIKYAVTSNSDFLGMFDGITFFLIENERMSKLTSTVTPQGLLFIAEIPSLTKPIYEKIPFAIFLNKIADPGNLGTILRTALSAGLRDIWISNGSVDPFSEKTIRAGLASQFYVNIHYFDEIESGILELKKNGFNAVYCTEPSHGKNCFEVENLFNKSIIVFGNEANGLDKIENSDFLNIPMPGGFESLNLAQSVTIVVYDAVRRNIFGENFNKN